MNKHNFDEKLDRRNSNCRKWDIEGKNIKYPMGVADTDFKIAKPITEAIKRKIDEECLGYGAGCEEFYMSVSLYLKRHNNIDVNSSHIRNAPGLMVALKLMCDAYTRPGDMIILQPPVYHSFRNTIERTGRFVEDNPLIYNEKINQYEIDFDDLRKKVKNPRVRMMIICNPHNPISRVYTKDELKKMYDICKENNVIIISDEVHSDIYYEGHKHTSMLSVDEKAYENVIIMSSNGKTFNLQGLYTSYVIIPDDYLREQFDLSYEYHHLDYSVLGSEAGVSAYTECDYYRSDLIEYLSSNVSYMKEFFNNNDIKVNLIDTQATYLAWLDFRKWDMTSKEVYDLLMKYDVLLKEGTNFGIGGEGFMRMNFGCHKDTLIGALDSIKRTYEDNIK